MATLNWNSLTEETYTFDPVTDVLHFDDPEITAGLGPDASHQFDYFSDPGDPNPTVYFGFGGEEHGLLNVDPRRLHSGNITFENGDIDSLFIYGDNTIATNTDDVANTINGGAGNDWLIGAGGRDTVNGGDGHDMLVVIGSGKLGTGAWGNDRLDGGAGVDHVFYDGATLGINVNLATGVSTGGRAGESTLTLVSIEQVATGVGNDTIVGSSAANYLFGNAGNDRLSGAGAPDILDGGSGADTMWGGTGNDRYYVGTTSDVVIEKSGEGTDTIFSSITWELGSHQDNLALTGNSQRNGTGNSLNNVIDGNNAANKLYGESGNDLIDGKGGNDTIFGGSGSDDIDGGEGVDSMIGGDGNDHYSVIEVGDTVVEEEDGGTDTITTNRSITMPDWVERLIWINNGAGGTCTGNDLNNVMSASGDGLNLTMNGGAGSDTVSFAGQDVEVEVNLNAGFATFINALISMENATGGNLDDDLRGDEAANRLDGSLGADTMTGGYGGDTYVVDDEGDVVTEVDNEEILLVLPGDPGAGLAAGDIVDTVRAAIDYSLASVNFVENIVLTGSALNATGNALNNVITGNTNGNTLDGGAGADTLNGGSGNDTLRWRPGESPTGVYNGGSGSDTLLVGGDADNCDLTQVGSSAILSIEKVDMRAGGSNALTLTRADVLAMSDNDKITVRGDDGDTVYALGFKRIADSGSYHQYTSKTAGATLLVEKDVDVLFVLT